MFEVTNLLVGLWTAGNIIEKPLIKMQWGLSSSLLIDTQENGDYNGEYVAEYKGAVM